MTRFLRSSFAPLLFEPDTGITPPAGGISTDPAQAFQNALQRNQGDAMALATRLFDENYQLRSTNRDMRTQLPAQGAVVLPPDQASAFAAYQQLGAVDAISAQLQTAQAAAAELATLKRAAHLANVAQIAGYKPSVLGTLAADRELLVREVGDKKMVVVKDGDRETPIADYASAHWADFLPALHASTTAAPQATGVPFVAQHGGTAQPNAAPDYLARFQAARDAAPSPFQPAK